MSLVIMSETELSRLDTVRKINEKLLSVVQAAKLHAVSRRQVNRWLNQFADDGAAGLMRASTHSAEPPHVSPSN